jgi:hypothetical protein
MVPIAFGVQVVETEIVSLSNDKKAAESRGGECVQKKNTHLLLCQVARLGLPLCFVTFPNCYEDASSDEE